MGNVLTLTPPLTVTEAQMLQALDIIAAVNRGCSGPPWPENRLTRRSNGCRQMT